MSAPTRTARRALLTSGPHKLITPRQPPLTLPEPICLSCRVHLRRASTATAPSPTPSPTSSQPRPSAPPAPQQSYRILTSVVLSRPPFLTRPLHPFEKAYHLYNRRLNERLALPFTRYFYYKKGTPQDGEWKRKIRARLTPSRDVGIYSGYGNEAWNDEVLVGDRTADQESVIEEVIRDAEVRFDTPATKPREGQEPPRKDEQVEAGTEGQMVASKKEPVPRPESRETEADRKGDRKSLNRSGERTLYLVVKNGAGRWVFPGDVVRGKEGLHQAAERVLVQAGGINMNTWVVGNSPIGWYQFDSPKTITNKDSNAEDLGEKVFFMKARIMAGQADLTKNVLGDTDFQWLTREELQETVTPQYYSHIKNMLSER
ncbi:39S mitochondrial ribosomal protein L46-like protein [Elsinoe fawcettii]|nr:39S mitochondrial ribosomal protein L46-like protein [Elsinoe fawcettii]